MLFSLFAQGIGASAGRGIASYFDPSTPKAAAPPAFQPSAPYAPPAPPAPAAPPDAPFYQREWFAPVAVVAGLGLAAFFLLPKRA